MYLFVDTCFLCLLNKKNIKNVLLEDDDGMVIEDKLKYILTELTNFKPDIRKNICIDCLQELNFVYKFKQKCFKNIIDLINNFENQTSETTDNCNSDIATVILQNEEHQSETNETDQDPLLETKENTEIQLEQNHKSTDIKLSLLFDENIQNGVIKQESGDIHYEIDIKCESVSLDDILADTEENPPDKIQSDPKNSVVLIEDSEEKIDIKCEELMAEEPYSENNFKNIFKMETTNISEHTSTPTTGEETNRSLPEYCERTFPCSSLKHTDKNSYKCDVCNKSFNQNNKLTLHKRTHFPDISPPFKCDLCHLTFNWKTHFIRHKRGHRKAFKCEVCSRTVHGKRNFKKHIRTHKSAKLLKCDLCEKTFMNRRDLIVHRPVHDIGKINMCEVCNKIFNSDASLRVHRLTHSIYQCNLCPYKCESNNILVQHIQTHISKRAITRCLRNRTNRAGRS